MRKVNLMLALLGTLSVLGIGACYGMPIREYCCSSDIIDLHLQAEQWVSTDTANVVVEFNGTANEKALATLHFDILSRLKKIYAGDWHITNFERVQDQSGLEKIRVQAEAQISESKLTELRKTTEAESKPGAKFDIVQIDFSPTVKDREQIKAALRKQLYAQVIQEMEAINRAYPNRHYQLSRLMFDGERPRPMVKREMAFAAQNKAVVLDKSLTSMAVSQKIYMIANVQFSARPSA